MDGAEKLCFNKVLSQLTHIEELCGGGITETVTVTVNNNLVHVTMAFTDENGYQLTSTASSSFNGTINPIDGSFIILTFERYESYPSVSGATLITSGYGEINLPTKAKAGFANNWGIYLITGDATINF